MEELHEREPSAAWAWSEEVSAASSLAFPNTNPKAGLFQARPLSTSLFASYGCRLVCYNIIISRTQSERCEFDDDLLDRDFDEELYEREPFRGMGAVRGAVRKFRGGSRHRQGGSAPSTPTEYSFLLISYGTDSDITFVQVPE